MRKTKQIIIIGAGGLGREVYRWVSDQIMDREEIEIEGFFDPDPHALKNYTNIKIPVIGTEDTVNISKDKLYVCAIGDIDIRAKVYEKVKNRGGRFFTIIHPSAKVGDSCVIEEGASLCPNVILTENVHVGKNVFLNFNIMCGHDARIGDHSVLCPGVNINGNVVIEKRVFIGSSAVITPGVRVAENCQVSAGSVVYRSNKSNSLLHGNPAREHPRIRE